ncbi:MAG: M24 family metallopeptidase [Planctomycetaceae bacterium]|nr:M24 family metallopeptidase [Planctomycetaceae bacterium]
MSIDLSAIQTALCSMQLDGWLLYDFRGLNVLALRVVGHDPQSRRVAAYIPARGEPKVLVHAIEPGAWSNVPGERRRYLRWSEFRSGMQWLVAGSKRIAMEYSPFNDNPYVSRVDGGTIELVKSFGVELESSGDLIQLFEARWDAEQWQMHQRASELNQQAFDIGWDFIGDQIRKHGGVREYAVQQRIMEFFAANGLTTYHPPIVGVNANAGDPHYEPLPGRDAVIGRDDLVLLDIWCRLDQPRAVYSDLTKMGFTGDRPSARHEEVFRIVAAARDAGIRLAQEAFSAGKEIRGFEVDDATRRVIADAGYGDFFIHRTGHNMGQETHGNGAHIDNLETRDTRRLLPGTCFTIEPGIYLPEFGVRSEVDVFIDWDGELHVTGGLQTEIKRISI